VKQEIVFMKPWFLAVFVLLQLTAPLLAAGRSMKTDDLLAVKGVSDPQLSPDGKTVAFAVTMPDVAANKSLHSVWTVPLEGGAPRKLADLADRLGGCSISSAASARFRPAT